jgi:hypothetical protein
LSRLDRSRSVLLTLDFLLRRKFHCRQAKALTKVGLIFADSKRTVRPPEHFMPMNSDIRRR